MVTKRKLRETQRRVFDLQLYDQVQPTECWDPTDDVIGPLECQGIEGILALRGAKVPTTAIPPLCRRCALKHLQARTDIRKIKGQRVDVMIVDDPSPAMDTAMSKGGMEKAMRWWESTKR